MGVEPSVEMTFSRHKIIKAQMLRYERLVCGSKHLGHQVVILIMSMLLGK